MSIVIEKGVPRPVGKAAGAEATAAANAMDIGDSFVLPEAITPGARRTFAGHLNRIFAPRRFISRTSTDGSVRVWRAA